MGEEEGGHPHFFQIRGRR